MNLLVHWTISTNVFSVYVNMCVDGSQVGSCPCLLPEDYVKRWVSLAEWSLQKQHGPGARYSLMFALTLRRSALSDRAHISYVSPRIWQVKDTIRTSERASLFADDLTHRLLDLVDITSDFPTPLFPKCVCGSQSVDDWAHGLASRKLYRGHTNFQALSVEFDLAVGQTWTPQEICVVSFCIFRNMFSIAAHEECCLLMNQLGVTTSKHIFKKTHLFGCVPTPPIGALKHDAGRTVFRAADLNSITPVRCC